MEEHSPSIRRQLFNYAVPSIAGMLIVGIQTFIDGLFVSKGLGALGLAAINLSLPIINIMTSIAIMIISGGVVIAGIAKGRGDTERAKSYTTLTFVILLSLSILLGIFTAINLTRLCYFLGANEELFPFVRNYLGIIGCGIFFFFIPNFTEAFTRFAGKPNWVFTSGTICCITNVILDYFFVIRFGWGVSGAAIATCIANTTAAIVLIHNVQFGPLSGGRKEIGKIFYNGSSEMLTSVSAAITTYVFNRVLMNEIGPKGVAALTIVSYLTFIVNMSIFGLSQALYPLASTNLGARNYKHIKSLLFNSLLFGGCIGIGTYLVTLIFKHPIVDAFTQNDTELHALAITAITFVTLHFLLSFINIVTCSFHTAIERPVESVVISLCRSIIFVLIPLFILTPFIGQLGIWLSIPIAELLTLAISLPLTARSLRKMKTICQ